MVPQVIRVNKKMNEKVFAFGIAGGKKVEIYISSISGEVKR